MNIGIVTTWFERGAAYVSKQILNTLKEDHNVFIYARGGEENAKGNPNWDFDNVTWGKDISALMTLTVINKKDFIKWVKENSIEAIIFNEQHWWEPVIWCNELNIITVAYIDYYKKDTIPFFEAYDYLLCNTKRHYSAFKWHKGAKYIPWGTDLNVFKEKDEKINEKVVFFHSCGMAPYRKGTDLLIRAFDNVKIDSKLLIHSQINLVDVFPNLSNTINKLITEDRLEIITKTVAAPGLNYLGDFYVYPGRLDGIGLTIAEASACGLPIVVTDTPPMNEFVGTTGYTIKVEKTFARSDGYYWPECEVNIDNLTEVLNKLSKFDTNMIKKLSNETRNYSVKYLDWNKNSRVINDLFKKNLSKMEVSENLYESIRLYENIGIKKLNKYIIKYYPVFKLLKKIVRK